MQTTRLHRACGDADAIITEERYPLDALFVPGAPPCPIDESVNAQTSLTTLR
jgi:hypothetical protein